MAARKEILSDLNSKIADGNIREAYRTFEELPVVDQIAVSISPGVGDALAAYEVGEFGRRAKTNIQDQDRLGAAGNIALSGLSLVSLYPLFRFLRGAKAVAKSGAKAVDAPKTLKPPVEEPLPPAPSKDVLPEVEPFTPKPIAELGYQTGPDQPVLQSKVRKFLNNHKVGTAPFNKNLQTATPEKWVEEFKKTNLPDINGELRLLNVLDEAGDIHPNLINTAGPNKEISRQSLDNYIARQQRNALNIRTTEFERNIGTRSSANPAFSDFQVQNVYFVRGSGKTDRSKLPPGKEATNVHYKDMIFEPGGLKGSEHYSFDGIGKEFDPIGSLDANVDSDTAGKISAALKELNLTGGEDFDGIMRIQSDFAQKAVPNISHAKRTPLEKISKELDDIYGTGLQSPENYIKEYSNLLEKGLKPEFLKAVRKGDNKALQKIMGDDLYKDYIKTVDEKVLKSYQAFTKAFDKNPTARGYLPSQGARSLGPSLKTLADSMKSVLAPDGANKIGGTLFPNKTPTTVKQGSKFFKLDETRFFEDQSINPASTNYADNQRLVEQKWNALSNKDKQSFYTEISRKEFMSRFNLAMEKELNLPTSMEDFMKSGGPETEKAFKKLIKNFVDDYELQSVSFTPRLLEKIALENQTGYLDPKQQKEIQKKLARYTKLQNRINTATARSFNETGSTNVPGSSADDLVELSGLRQDLGIDNFEISTKDIERFTGKSFTESLPKSLDEIYYEIDPATGRQKYFDAGPNPAARAKAYLDDVSDPESMFMELANGVTIIKKAINPKITKEGFMPDPYLIPSKRGKLPQHSHYGKLPVRASILRSYQEGADGIYLGKAQATSEGMGGKDTVDRIVGETYNRNLKEIEKVLNELLPNPKDRVGALAKVENTDTFYDGTYLKFTDELKAAIAEKGVDAFKDGGPVDIDKMLAEL